MSNNKRKPLKSSDGKIYNWKRVKSTVKNNEIPRIDLCSDTYVPCDSEKNNKLIDDKAYRMEIALKALKQQFEKMMKFVETGNIPSNDDSFEEIEISAKGKETLSKIDIENKKIFRENLKKNLKIIKKIKSKNKKAKTKCAQFQK